ncbi:MAG: GntR family transcriptional regulator [Pyrinomonadaceae bacterium]
MMKLIQPISKKDQVVLAIKDAILSGAVEPGDQIVESRMAQQLGTGIPLVREALIDLEHQGFVQKTPFKGTSVTKLSPEEVRDIFRLRVELESLAVGWASGRVTEGDVKELRGLIDGMRRAAAEGPDLGRFYEHDLAFHRKLWALSGNQYLVGALERVIVPLFAFFVMRNPREQESYAESAAAHARIVEALPGAGEVELRALMRESLEDWQDDMLALLFPEH